MGQKSAPIRALPDSRAVPSKIDQDDAYHRAQSRAQDMAKDREDPIPGDVEDRARAIRRKNHK